MLRVHLFKLRDPLFSHTRTNNSAVAGSSQHVPKALSNSLTQVLRMSKRGLRVRTLRLVIKWLISMVHFAWGRWLGLFNYTYNDDYVNIG